MDTALVAAWIAAGAAVAGTIVTVWTTRQQNARQHDFEKTVNATQHAFEQQQIRFGDRRDTYRAFLSPAEALFDLLAQYVRPGEASRYEIALELTSVVEQLVPEADPGPELANPLPELDPDGQEATHLRELSTSTRTQRVMVALVGPEEVSAAAMRFERSMRVATGAVLSRDAPAALKHFLEAAHEHEEFIAEAKRVLDAEHQARAE